MTSTDRAERILLQAAAERADRLVKRRAQVQAIEVVNALSKATEDS